MCLRNSLWVTWNRIMQWDLVELGYNHRHLGLDMDTKRPVAAECGLPLLGSLLSPGMTASCDGHLHNSQVLSARKLPKCIRNLSHFRLFVARIQLVYVRPRTAGNWFLQLRSNRRKTRTTWRLTVPQDEKNKPMSWGSNCKPLRKNSMDGLRDELNKMPIGVLDGSDNQVTFLTLRASLSETSDVLHTGALWAHPRILNKTANAIMTSCTSLF